MERAEQELRGGRTRATRAATLEVHIEELVLLGFEPGDHFPVGDVVERELTRLLTEQPGWTLASAPFQIERLNGGAFTVAAGGKPATLGAEIARAVHGAIGGAKETNSAQKTSLRTRDPRSAARK